MTHSAAGNSSSNTIRHLSFSFFLAVKPVNSLSLYTDKYTHTRTQIFSMCGQGQNKPDRLATTNQLGASYFFFFDEKNIQKKKATKRRRRRRRRKKGSVCMLKKEKSDVRVYMLKQAKTERELRNALEPTRKAHASCIQPLVQRFFQPFLLLRRPIF